jgi:hypothetical protein
MKKSIITTLAIMFIAFSVFAQVPQAFKYQAIARTLSGSILANQNISLRISLLKGGPNGNSVYCETHNVTSSGFGMMNIEIGNGIYVSGNFSNIDWSTGLYYVKIEMDETGSTGYNLMGTSQLLSVPYALYAGNATNSGMWVQDSNNIYSANAGNVGIGTSNPTANLHVYSTKPSLTINSLSEFRPILTSNSSSNLVCQYNQFYVNSSYSFSGYLYGAVNRVVANSGQTGTLNKAIGSNNNFINLGSAQVNTAYGSYHSVENNSSGIITNAYGLFSAIANNGAGSITNGYGVYIPSVSATNKWSIYAADAAAPSYFAGNIGIGTSEPYYKLTFGSTSDKIGLYYDSLHHASIQFYDPITADMVFNTTNQIAGGNFVFQGGDINIQDIGTGIIMTSPNGQCWRVTINNSGAFVSTAITCP